MHKSLLISCAMFLSVSVANAAGLKLNETAYFKQQVESGALPAIDKRLPEQPLVVDLGAKGRSVGKQGGTLRTMVSRTKDVRQMVVYGYSRLVGYDEDYNLIPDILLRFEVEDNRKYTLHLRPGHRWSDGHLFTSADFEYWWNEVANNPDLSPSGPPVLLQVDGESPTVTFPDEHTVVYEWSKANPRFLPLLAQARPPFIYRPRHYLEQFHDKFAEAEHLKKAVQKKRVRSWSSLHSKLDNMYKFDNYALPTLHPWIATEESVKSQRVFSRNPYYHRVDETGTQLPYIDKVEMSIVGGGLIAAKANAGEVDLQARGLDFKDVSILKKGENDGGNYRVHLWGNGVASQMAIYPNLHYKDPEWRKVMRDVRFRRALSLGIDRRTINRALYFGLGKAGGMTALSASPFFSEENRAKWSQYDVELANKLLDEIGLTDRDGDGIRLLPDGRRAEVLVETAGERQEVENALQIITDTWRELGVKLLIRPQDRDILRNHVYSGASMFSVWFGWDNGIPTPQTSPAYLAPVDQDFLAWPMWGQYHQTGGKAGEAPDMPEPKHLMALSTQWNSAETDEERSAIWAEMLAIHAEQVYGIGIVSETPQPVVVSKRLRNVPEEGVWAWDPGAHFGIHRPDEFYFVEENSS